VERWRPRSKRGCHGRCSCSDWVADGWALAVSDFLNLSETGLTFKIKMGTYLAPKIANFLHVSSLGYYEQLSQFCRHQIPNKNGAKNPGKDSTFESLMNFNRDLILPEKSDKFPKNPS
jgi:hypothetical protein